MTYKQYNSDKTYVVEHHVSLGIMESPITFDSIVGYYNTLADASYMSASNYLANNSKSDIESSWTNDHYPICINTSTEEGKKLLEEFRERFNKEVEEGIKEGRYGKPIEFEGNQYYTEYNEIFDKPPTYNSSTESYRMTFLDFTNKTIHENNTENNNKS